MKSTSMRGGGYYDQNSSIQRNTNSTTIPLIVQAIESTLNSGLGPDIDQPFCIVDYGSSEGKNSAQAVKQAIATIRKLRPTQPICVIHNDLHTNDFNRLFHNIYQDGEDSYLEQFNKDNIFVFASGSSFYNQILPPKSVHLGLSSWSAHWLSQAPDIRMNHIYYGGAKGEERSKLARQAAEDWQRFLSMRAAEFARGGKFVVALPSSLGDPVTGDDLERGSQNLMNTKLQEMLAEGVVDKEIYEKFIYPFYFRTLDEAMAPFTTAGSPLIDEFSVDHSTVEEFACPMYAEYLRSKDIDGYADAYVAWLRAWSEPLLAKGVFSLSTSTEAAAHKMAIDFYDRVRRAVHKKPDAYIFQIETAFLVLSKR